MWAADAATLCQIGSWNIPHQSQPNRGANIRGTLKLTWQKKLHRVSSCATWRTRPSCGRRSACGPSRAPPRSTASATRSTTRRTGAAPSGSTSTSSPSGRSTTTPSKRRHGGFQSVLGCRYVFLTNINEAGGSLAILLPVMIIFTLLYDTSLALCQLRYNILCNVSFM